MLCPGQWGKGRAGGKDHYLCPSPLPLISKWDYFPTAFLPTGNQNNELRLILSSLGGINRTGEIYSQRHYWLTFQTKGLYEVHLYKHSLFMTSVHQVILGRGISVRLFTAGLFNSWTVTFRKKSKMKTFSVVACTQVLACGGHWGVGPWESGAVCDPEVCSGLHKCTAMRWLLLQGAGPCIGPPWADGYKEAAERAEGGKCSLVWLLLSCENYQC